MSLTCIHLEIIINSTRNRSLFVTNTHIWYYAQIIRVKINKVLQTKHMYLYPHQKGNVNSTQRPEMAGWHHWLDGRESEWTLGVGDGQGGPACCDSWGRKESDTTERMNWTERLISVPFCSLLLPPSSGRVSTILTLTKWIRFVLCSLLISTGTFMHKLNHTMWTFELWFLFLKISSYCIASHCVNISTLPFIDILELLQILSLETF